MKRSYHILFGGCPAELIIESPTFTTAAYRVSRDGVSLGCIYPEIKSEKRTVWRASTTVLMPYAEELGDFISWSEARVTAERRVTYNQ